MIHLVTGGSGSGKSAYAEDWLSMRCEGGRLLYVAAMRPFGEEAKRRIERHRLQRQEKGFDTLEWYQDLEQAEVPFQNGILLECMSNLLANEFFRMDGTMAAEDEVRDKILRGIRHLEAHTELLVIVTNEVSADLGTYSRETIRYQRLLGKLNQELAKMAQLVTEVVYGIPVVIKEGTKKGTKK